MRMSMANELSSISLCYQPKPKAEVTSSCLYLAKCYYKYFKKYLNRLLCMVMAICSTSIC
jgi:hypothetical protein